MGFKLLLLILFWLGHSLHLAEVIVHVILVVSEKPCPFGSGLEALARFASRFALLVSVFFFPFFCKYK
jgi:hypothetical protein